MRSKRTTTSAALTYQASQIRRVVLAYNEADFEEVIRLLEAAAERTNTTTHSATVLALLKGLA